MSLPWIVTSATCPRLTSFRKSENARVACGPRLDEVWNKLSSATRSSPITIQRARFLPKLFTSRPFHAEPGIAGREHYPQPGEPARIFARFTDKARPRLNNCKACPCQRIDRPKNKLRD